MTIALTRPYRVLALDGGGMRGFYTAVLLQTLAARLARLRDIRTLDIGKGFGLITGTSTGGILADLCAPAERVRSVQNGKQFEGGIF